MNEPDFVDLKTLLKVPKNEVKDLKNRKMPPQVSLYSYHLTKEATWALTLSKKFNLLGNSC